MAGGGRYPLVRRFTCESVKFEDRYAFAIYLPAEQDACLSQKQRISNHGRPVNNQQQTTRKSARHATVQIRSSQPLSLCMYACWVLGTRIAKMMAPPLRLNILNIKVRHYLDENALKVRMFSTTI